MSSDADADAAAAVAPASDSFLSSSSSSDDETEERPDLERIASERSVELRLMEILDTQAALPPRRSLAVVAERTPSDDDGAGAGAGRRPLPVHERHAYPCADTHSVVPPTRPEKWPQRPLLLRPAPEGGMRVRGVRLSSSEGEYLPLSGTGFCSGCTLPINGGREAGGRCLVVDFETEWFVGTAALRIKNAPPALEDEAGEGGGDDYFRGRRRTFAAVVRGRFMSPSIPMSSCVTGQTFRRPAGSLPNRFVLKGAVKIISHLAPQLRADFDGQRPCFLSPLVSTAQTVLADGEDPAVAAAAAAAAAAAEEKGGEGEDEDRRLRLYRIYPGADATIERAMEEPHPADARSVHRALLEAQGTSPPKLRKDASAHARTKARKRACDRLFASGAPEPCFDTGTVYTFEFFQHLLVFDEFAVDLGGVAGRHGLRNVLDGQPLKFMAAVVDEDGGEGGGKGKKKKGGGGAPSLKWLWNFDIWHECLYDDAVSAEG